MHLCACVRARASFCVFAGGAAPGCRLRCKRRAGDAELERLLKRCDPVPFVHGIPFNGFKQIVTDYNGFCGGRRLDAVGVAEAADGTAVQVRGAEELRDATVKL